MILHVLYYYNLLYHNIIAIVHLFVYYSNNLTDLMYQIYFWVD